MTTYTYKKGKKVIIEDVKDKKTSESKNEEQQKKSSHVKVDDKKD